MRSPLLPVALLGAVAALGLTGCVNNADATEDEIARVVTEYFALLEAGQAEAAGALDTFNPAEAECPDLFTDEVYATVADRPTNLEITSIQHYEAGDEDYAETAEAFGGDGDGLAMVSARFDVAEQRGIRAQLTVHRSGERWTIGHEHGLVGGLIIQSSGPRAGEVSLQGACATPLDDLSTTVAVYPGTWTAAYTDPEGIGIANEWTASSQGALMGAPALERALVRIEVVPDPDVLDRAQESMTELVDECADSLLTSPSCPEDVTEHVSQYPGPVQSVTITDYPVVEIRDGLPSWKYRTDQPRLTWVDAEGVERETTLFYTGDLSIDDGVVVLTQDPRQA